MRRPITLLLAIAALVAAMADGRRLGRPRAHVDQPRRRADCPTMGRCS